MKVSSSVVSNDVRSGVRPIPISNPGALAIDARS
jgi:hypothetical protein